MGLVAKGKANLVDRRDTDHLLEVDRAGRGDGISDIVCQPRSGVEENPIDQGLAPLQRPEEASGELLAL